MVVEFNTSYLRLSFRVLFFPTVIFLMLGPSFPPAPSLMLLPKSQPASILRSCPSLQVPVQAPSPYPLSFSIDHGPTCLFINNNQLSQFLLFLFPYLLFFFSFFFIVLHFCSFALFLFSVFFTVLITQLRSIGILKDPPSLTLHAHSHTHTHLHTHVQTNMW